MLIWKAPYNNRNVKTFAYLAKMFTTTLHLKINEIKKLKSGCKLKDLKIKHLAIGYRLKDIISKDNVISKIPTKS